MWLGDYVDLGGIGMVCYNLKLTKRPVIQYRSCNNQAYHISNNNGFGKFFQITAYGVVIV